MNNQSWITIVVSFLTDLIISSGGCMTTAMVATGSTTMPNKAVMLFAVVTGLIAAARRVQALLTPTPPPKVQ